MADPKPTITVQQGTAKPPPLDLIINWGEPSSALQTRHLAAAAPITEGTRGTSFWLVGSTATAPSAGPATLDEIATADLATWTTATPTPIALTLQASKVEARGQVKPGTSVRLDFDLKVTIGASPGSVLRFAQLIAIDASGNLSGSKFTIDSYRLVPVAKAAQVGSEGRRPPARTVDPTRELSGLHPLIKLTQRTGTQGAKIVIDAQFVDATELWWASHASGDRWRWYLHPDLGGRQDNLRVLAWTTGASPMLWFVAVTDKAASSIAPSGSSPAADVVFFRPPPGSNAFPFFETEKGFTDARHQNTTLHILARYLLAPVPMTTASAAAGAAGPGLLADQIQPATPRSSDPMDTAANVWPAFVPVGLEQAIARTGQPHVLYLPLGWDGLVHRDPKTQQPAPQAGDRPAGGYHAALLANLKPSLKQATMVLFNTGAIARSATATPDPGTRKLWAAGHSAGNFSLAAMVKANAQDVDRVISVDPSGGPFAGIKASIDAVVRARGAVEAFVISSPNLLDDKTHSHTHITRPAGVVTKVDFDALTPASFSTPVVTLPDTAAEPTYWQTVPVAGMNGYLRHLLGLWSDAEVESSAADPGKQRPAANNLNWYFLFFHEYAVYGGHREGETVTRTFFEDALGPVSFGSLSVTLVEAVGGVKPVPNAKVTATGPIVRVGLTDAAGKVTLTNLTPGSYTVEGVAFELGPNSTTATVAAGNGNAPVTIKLVFNPSGP